MAARLEVTGRKFPSVDEAAVYTIPQFLKAHNISYGKFYQMCKQGLGPDMMEYGTRRVISVEAAARWRDERAKAKK
jgi:hypothetical protein